MTFAKLSFLSVLCAFARVGVAQQSSVTFPNGAMLEAQIDDPKENGKLFLPHASSNTTEVSVSGIAHVEKGAPNVTYIYVIDTSESTNSADGACGTTLECTQAFISALHQEAVDHGSASMVAVITFDDSLYVAADLQDIGDNETAIQEAIFSGHSDGFTTCQPALDKANEFVEDPRNTATMSMIIFVGDGQCQESTYCVMIADPAVMAPIVLDTDKPNQLAYLLVLSKDKARLFAPKFQRRTFRESDHRKFRHYVFRRKSVALTQLQSVCKRRLSETDMPAAVQNRPTLVERSESEEQIVQPKAMVSDLKTCLLLTG